MILPRSRSRAIIFIPYKASEVALCKGVLEEPSFYSFLSRSFNFTLLVVRPLTYYTMKFSTLFFSSQLLWSASAFLAYEEYQVKRLVEEYDLPESCAKVMLTDIDCDASLDDAGSTGWQGSIEEGDDFKITDSICANKCGDSLKNWTASFAKYCEPEGFRPGNMMEGRRQICDKDAKTGKYCNGWLTNSCTCIKLIFSQLLSIRFPTRMMMKNFLPSTSASLATSDASGDSTLVIIAPPTVGSSPNGNVWTSYVPSQC